MGATQAAEFAHKAVYERPEAGDAIQQLVDIYSEFERRDGVGGQELTQLMPRSAFWDCLVKIANSLFNARKTSGSV